ncbi:class I SAM-dependent methyltransferase [Cellulosimicrobium cellulans]|uniref:class I SAM-dependent methyltransferase n=1 Tax=Cellulosimicrobium cellulans TaxID=1710 RepID=UPI0019657B87|nr:class I SAM-dependent methyltransferase [Cellulosimicrobium cellulans]MBN0040668.1 class I SAM-dependent methyltransferase [Cellulosimicrobium cellulans]
MRGLNLAHYPTAVLDGHLTGVERSPGMLQVARRRTAELGIDVDLRLGDTGVIERVAARTPAPRAR